MGVAAPNKQAATPFARSRRGDRGSAAAPFERRPGLWGKATPEAGSGRLHLAIAHGATRYTQTYAFFLLLLPFFFVFPFLCADALPQPVTFTFVFCSTTAPFWPVMIVGMLSVAFSLTRRLR